MSFQRDVEEVKSELYRKADRHEVHTLDSKVDCLERELGEVRSTCDGLRSELSQLQEGYRKVLSLLSTMTEVIKS